MFELHDSHGAPQCGCEVIRFEEWYEVEDYISEHPDVCERIDKGYAVVLEA